MDFLSDLHFDEKGLIPAVIQDIDNLRVLTLCYMSAEALKLTLESGKIHVFRRSKGRIMLKGETSGCTQEVKEVFVDCAGNSVLFKVKQKLAACHEGYFSCYFRKYDNKKDLVIEEERLFDPEDLYK